MNSEGDPGVTGTVSARRADDEAGVVPKVQKLPPGPECEVVTIASPGLLERFGRRPVIWHSELFPIGNVAAGRQKRLDLSHVPTDDLQRLAEERSHRAPCKVVSFFGLRYALAINVVTAGNDFRDHNALQFLTNSLPVTLELGGQGHNQ